MSQENIRVVEVMLEAFNRGDSDAVAATFAEDCELHEPPEMPDRPVHGFRGHSGIREWVGKLRGVAEVTFEPRGFSGTGDVIVSELVSRGRGQASGVPIQWITFTVFRMRGGKIARANAFLTQSEALEAARLTE